MHIEKMDQLVTISDLHKFQKELLTTIENLISEKQKKEFYTPREFHEITGLKYSTVIYYCNIGQIKARQKCNRGVWSISHSEVERFKQEAHNNTRIIPLHHE